MKKLLTIGVLLGVAGGLLGCSEDEAEAGDPPEANNPPAEAAEEVAEAVNEAPLEAAEEAAGAAPTAEAEGGGDACAQAYDEIMQMREQMQQQMGEGQGEMVPREDFLAGCNELPDTVQRCMQMSYAQSHQAECQEARANLDPQLAARVAEMMGRGE